VNEVQIIVVGASLLTLLLPFVGLLVGFRRVLPTQLVLFPTAHVYPGGMALIATILGLAFFESWRRPSLPVPITLLLVWVGWALLVLCSLAGGLPSTTQISQIVQFAVYGAVVIGLTVVLRVAPRLREKLIHAMVLSAFVLSLVMILMFRGGIRPDGLPFVTIGPNEHSMVLVLMGVVPSLYLQTMGNYRERMSAWITIIVSLTAMLMAESRGGIAIALALITGTLSYSITSRRLWIAVTLHLAFISAVLQMLQAAGLTAMLLGAASFSDLERLALVQASLRLFLERPLLGWGWGTIDAIMPMVPETVNSYPHAHNTFAHFAIEQGVLGLALLLILIFQVFLVATRRKAEGYNAESLFAILLGMALIATSLVEDLFYGASRAMAVVLTLAVIHGFVPQEVRNSRTTPKSALSMLLHIPSRH
jgi:O-antigen ligase